VYETIDENGVLHAEIVDWKTGRAPRTETEIIDKYYQPQLYRHAYARWAGIPAENVTATLYYVQENREIRLLDLPENQRLSFADLEKQWLDR
ncbi:MAG: PD-(D/E)XK nuclease family protein, partial [Microbacteriaceae bacterium]|nr:PD-(D/E)XK nuclease family protein [Microbacteriaceae bacterium]